LSFEEIRTPADFFGHLLSRFDRLLEESALPVEHFKSMGVHVLLRAVDAVYLATSSEADVFVHRGGGLVPVVGAGPVERLRLERGEAQQELFPHEARDVFSVLRLVSLSGEEDLVLGCMENEKSTVLEGLSSPVWVDEGSGGSERASRKSVVSKFVSRKVLVVRFGSLDAAREAIVAVPSRARRGTNLLRRRRVWGLATAAVVAAVMIGVLWREEPSDPEAGAGARVATRSGTPDRQAMGVVERSPLRPREGGDEKPVLSEAWRNSYSDAVTSSPAVSGGLVLFGCRDGNVYALERGSGELLWRYTAAAGVGASPAVLGERLIVADYNGWVYALTAKSGSEIWKRRLPAKIVSSPEVMEDRVLVGCMDGYAYCLSAVDGNVYWKKKTNGRIRGSPASSEGAFFVPSYDGHLYALSAASGDLLWRSALGGPVSSSPAASKGSVVVGAPDGTVHCLESATGRSRWRYSTRSPVKSSIAVGGGMVFVGTNDGSLFALNLADGTLVWKHGARGAFLARPLVVDGVVYAGCYDGRFYALEAHTGRLLGSFAAGAEVYSSAAADEERVYFGTNGGDFVCLSRGVEVSS
jgi:outer membrane protein assembly factor BamB